MKKGITLIALCVLISTTLIGCFPENKTIYDGPLQVEFNPVTATLRTAQATQYEMKIQLIGPHQDVPINVRFEIDTANSTSQLGTHFDFESMNVTIPANSSFGYIKVNAIPQNVTGITTLRVVLLGDDTGKVKAAENYKTFTLTIRP